MYGYPVLKRILTLLVRCVNRTGPAAQKENDMMDKCERCGSEPDIDYYGIALCKICRQDLESKAESLTEP